MKYLVFMFFLSCTFMACEKPSLVERTITIPIYKYSTESEAEQNLLQKPPQSLGELGNIYVYDDYLFINEKGEGIHIYDNSDSSNPVNLSFMQIPGNFDMAIANDVLFADSFDDLLSLDISDMQNIQLIERKNNVYPFYHPSTFGVIVGYKDSVIYFEEGNDPIFPGFGGNDLEVGTTASANGTNTGVGGSFARFTYFDHHLYCVDRSTLRSFNVSNPSQIDLIDTETINAIEVETIFNYEDHLFVGTTDGVFLYEAEPGGSIRYKDAFVHATACDPVYVSDDIAFVTLRSNNEGRCFNNINQLDIVDASDFNQLRFIKSEPMTYPHGIGIQDSLVFVCEAQHGLKVYKYEKVVGTNNVLQDVKLDLKHWNKSIAAIDIIPFQNHIIVVNQNELHQYSYNSQGQLQLISTL